MKQEIQGTASQEEKKPLRRKNGEKALPRYQSPQVIVYGTVIQLTKGSGGAYNDECTSGKQPGDDE
jgi:hypothetical protein